MLKLWGAGLIIIAGLYAIFLQRSENSTRRRQLCRWITLLETMQSEIRWYQVSLVEFLEKQPETKLISTYLKRKYTLQQSWEIVMQKIDDKEVSEVMKGLRFSGDRESLLNSLAYAVQQLRKLDDHRCSEAGKQGKIQSAAVLSGVGLLIILLL